MCVTGELCGGGWWDKVRVEKEDYLGGMWGLYQDDHHVRCVMRCTRQMGH